MALGSKALGEQGTAGDRPRLNPFSRWVDPAERLSPIPGRPGMGAREGGRALWSGDA